MPASGAQSTKCDRIMRLSTVFEIAVAGRFATCYVAIEMVGLVNSMKKW